MCPCLFCSLSRIKLGISDLRWSLELNLLWAHIAQVYATLGQADKVCLSNCARHLLQPRSRIARQIWVLQTTRWKSSITSRSNVRWDTKARGHRHSTVILADTESSRTSLRTTPRTNKSYSSRHRDTARPSAAPLHLQADFQMFHRPPQTSENRRTTPIRGRHQRFVSPLTLVSKLTFLSSSFPHWRRPDLYFVVPK